MRTRGFSAVIIAMLMTVFGAARATSAADAADVIQIDIVYTSDIHGHLDRMDATFLNPQFPPPIGGAASATAYINKVRDEAKAKGHGFLLVDSGDLFQGTAVGMFNEGKAVIEWMNSVGYTAAALGNHDFDRSWQKTKELVEFAKFPILCANLYDSKTNERVPWVKDVVTTDAAGVKVAIIGMVTEATTRMSLSKNIEGLNFRPLHEMLPSKIEQARATGADLVIFPVHAGLPYKPTLQRTYRDMIEAEARGERPEEYEAMELAHYIPGIDIIFAGHSHQGYDVPWEDPVTHTLVVEPYANGSSVGHITISYDKKARTMVGYETHHDRGALVTLFEDEFWPDQGTAETIAQRVQEAESGLDEVIGETRVNLMRGDADKGNLGGLVADAIREFTAADVAIQNTGGVRADIAPGKITKRHCLEVLPFGNVLETVMVKGEFLKRLFELKVGSYGPSLFVAGVTIEYNPDRAEGDRITSFMVGDKPLDPQADYKLALTNYLAEGQSGLTLMREIDENAFEYTQSTDNEALQKYIRDHTPIEAKSTNRWVRVSS